MSLAFNGQTDIIRTERGLTISGTRITLYDVMDYLIAQYPARFICALFDLTDDQINAALAYIEANWAEVDAEYQMVLKQAEENRQYWKERNRERFAGVTTPPSRPGRAALWAKLQEQKSRHEVET